MNSAVKMIYGTWVVQNYMVLVLVTRLEQESCQNNETKNEVTAKTNKMNEKRNTLQNEKNACSHFCLFLTSLSSFYDCLEHCTVIGSLVSLYFQTKFPGP